MNQKPEAPQPIEEPKKEEKPKINYLIPEEDRYVKVEIKVRPDEQGRPIIVSDEEYVAMEDKASVVVEWAKFLRPGWALRNYIDRISGDSSILMAENIIKYLLKDWSFPFELKFVVDVNGYVILSNFREIFREDGLSSIVADALFKPLQNVNLMEIRNAN